MKNLSLHNDGLDDSIHALNEKFEKELAEIKENKSLNPHEKELKVKELKAAFKTEKAKKRFGLF